MAVDGEFNPNMENDESFDAEITDMISINIISDLPQFNPDKLGFSKSILASKLLQWNEFLDLVEMNEPYSNFILKGSNGSVLSFNHPIGDYVESFPEKRESYSIIVEKFTPVNSKVGASSAGISKAVVASTSSRNRRSPRKRRFLELETKPQKLEKTDGKVNIFGKEDPAANFVTGRIDVKRKVVNASTSSSKNISSNAQQSTNGLSLMPNGGTSYNDLQSDNSSETDSFSKNPAKCTQPVPNLKPRLLQFLTNKVSNKDMMKVREELYKLKDLDDYFKLTSLTPLTAGLLDQMLCRPVASNPTRKPR